MKDNLNMARAEDEEPLDDGVSTSFESVRFTLYTRRWFILAVLALLQASNALIWLSYAPIADYSAKFYSTTTDVVNYLSLVYMVASAVFGALSAFVLDYMGLRAGIITGAWLNFVGALVKLFSACDFVSQAQKVYIAFVGQSLAALAQPYIMFATTKLAALWFPENKRALANTIGSMANPMGILIGSLLAPAIVTGNKGVGYNEMLELLAIHCGPAGLAALSSLVIITSSKPPTPPSASAEEDSMSFIAGVKHIFKSYAYWILMTSVGAGIALFTVLTTLLQQILCPHGYTDSYAGLCGALMIGCGIVGAAITGVICDKTRKFEEVAKTCNACAVAAAALFSIMVRYPDQQGLVALSVSLFGFFGFGLYPICLELGVEVTYPVAEATSTAFIIMSGQVQGIIYLVVMQTLAGNMVSDDDRSTCVKPIVAQDFTNANIFFLAAAFTMATLWIVLFKADYKRMRAEQEADAQRILSFSSSQPHLHHM